jgi:hypothetical protein
MSEDLKSLIRDKDFLSSLHFLSESPSKFGEDQKSSEKEKKPEVEERKEVKLAGSAPA